MVTGATGFIGKHLVSFLLERGHEVIAVARDETKASKMLWYSDVKFHAHDIHAVGFLPTLEQYSYPDAVAHLAWPGLPNHNELYHFEENLPADYKFIKSLIYQGLKQILVAGTCFEYGIQNGCLKEDFPTFPVNPYALAKDTLRKFLKSLQKNSSFNMQWARLFYMYGAGQHPGSLLAQLDSAIESGAKYFDMSGGEQLRDYLPVETVAKKLVFLLEHTQYDGVVNICSGKAISIRKLVEQHLARRDVKIRLNLYCRPYSDYEPMAFWGDVERYETLVRGFYELS